MSGRSPQRGDLYLPRMAALAALLTVASYGVSLQAPFHWDDYDIIVPTQALRSLGNVPGFFRPGYWVSTGSPRLRPYRPVREAYFALLYEAFRDKATGWHAANLLLHAANTILLYLLLVGIFRSIRLATCAAVLFAVHPAHVEAVVWIKNAGELLAFFFAMIAGILYLNAYFKWDLLPVRSVLSQAFMYVLSVAAFLTAICAKESAVVLPVILMLATLASGRSERGNRRAFAWAALVLCILAVLIYGSMQLGKFSDSEINVALQASGRRSLPVKLAHSVETVWRYGTMMMMPVRNHAWHEPLRRQGDLTWGSMLPSAVGGILILCLALRLSLRNPSFMLGFWWMFLGLAPVANLVAYNTARPLAEQRVYMPSAGWCLLLALALAAVQRARRVLTIVLTVILTALSMSTSLSWRHRKDLWIRSIRYSPRVAGAHCNLGNIYNDFELHRLGHTQHLAAAQFDPGSAQILNNIGAGLERTGDLEGAIEKYEAALRIAPTYAKARHNLATALMDQGRIEEAKSHLDRILESQPEYVPALISRADILGRRDRVEEAISDLRAAIRKEPGNVDALYTLGRAYHIQHRHAEALKYYEKAIEVSNELAEPQAGRGRCLASLGRTQEALAALRRAAQLDPNLIEPRRVLAQLSSLMNRHAESADYYSQCLELARQQNRPEPERLALLRLMARELNYAGRKDEARKAWQSLIRIVPDDPEALEALGQKSRNGKKTLRGAPATLPTPQRGDLDTP